MCDCGPQGCRPVPIPAHFMLRFTPADLFKQRVSYLPSLEGKYQVLIWKPSGCQVQVWPKPPPRAGAYARGWSLRTFPPAHHTHRVPSRVRVTPVLPRAADPQGNLGTFQILSENSNLVRKQRMDWTTNLSRSKMKVLCVIIVFCCSFGK